MFITILMDTVTGLYKDTLTKHYRKDKCKPFSNCLSSLRSIDGDFSFIFKGFKHWAWKKSLHGNGLC